jgi:hypothetical protein
MFKVYGLKHAKRDPIRDTSKSVVGPLIDDGTNHPISLCTTDSKNVAEFFLKSIKERVHGKSWKIWMEEVK